LEVLILKKESTILLLESKLRAYKNGFLRAKENNDEAAALKWKKGYREIRDRIYEIKQS
jgi:hypothetical protein